MAEYIDKAKILAELDDALMSRETLPDCDLRVIKIIRIFKLMINDFPAADVQPIKHGRWKDGEKSQVCTICGGWGLDSFAHCPHCGARMDLKDGDTNG